MELITAERARALTRSRDAHIEREVEELTRNFNAYLMKVAEGIPGKEGIQEFELSISVLNSIKKDAAARFVQALKDVGYTVTSRGPSDDLDAHYYRISWA